MGANGAPHPRARILGAGLTVTLERPRDGSRIRAQVIERRGLLLRVEPLPGGSLDPVWGDGGPIRILVARPFGLFCYEADPLEPSSDGDGHLRIRPGPVRRRQLREFFRLPIRLGVRLEPEANGGRPTLAGGVDLSAGGILVLDSDGMLRSGDRVRIGLPIGPNRSLLRLAARVVRVEPRTGRAALEFDGIGESARQTILRFLFREHRRRARLRRSGSAGARVTALPGCRAPRSAAQGLDAPPE